MIARLTSPIVSLTSAPSLRSRKMSRLRRIIPDDRFTHGFRAPHGKRDGETADVVDVTPTTMVSRSFPSTHFPVPASGWGFNARAARRFSRFTGVARRRNPDGTLSWPTIRIASPRQSRSVFYVSRRPFSRTIAAPRDFVLEISTEGKDDLARRGKSIAVETYERKKQIC